MDTQTTQSNFLNTLKVSSVFCVLGTVSLLSTGVSADVKSLTSTELTQTYIKDSTVIITPKARKNTSNGDKNLASLTISPGRAPISPAQEEYAFGKILDDTGKQIDGAIANIDEITREAAFSLNRAALASVPLEVPSVTFQTARVGGFPGLEIPQGDFNLDFIGSELGMSRVGDQLKFSFGNIPGVGAINAPQSINENGIKLQPRQGGGFDLTFTVPK